MSEGEFKKLFKDLFGERCKTYEKGCPNCDAWAKLDEARKDFIHAYQMSNKYETTVLLHDWFLKWFGGSAEK